MSNTVNSSALTASNYQELLENVVEYIVETSYDNIPMDALERTKQTLVDILGCTVSGWKDRAAHSLGDMVRTRGGNPESTLWGRQAKVPANQAAFACSISARSFDYGAIESTAPGTFQKPLHSAETSVPTALAMAERCHSTGQEMLTALTLGEDLVGRLTAAMEFSLPLDCRGTVNTLGATVIAGKLLKLTRQQFYAAFGLALHQLNGVKQGVHFSLGQGFSAMQGINAAEMAALGLYGVDNISAEFLKVGRALQVKCNTADLLDKLGKEFYSTVTFKPYPAVRATHSAIECGLDLVRQGVKPQDLVHVTLTLSPWAMAHPSSRPFSLHSDPHSDALYSQEYALASALVRGRCTLDCYTEEAIADPTVQAMIKKIRMSSEGWPLHDDDIFLSAGVTAVTAADKTYQAVVHLARGHEKLGMPLSNAEKKSKFLSNVAFSETLSATQAEQAYQQLCSVEELSDIAKLSQLF